MGWTGNKADLYNAILNGIPYAGFIAGTFIAPFIMGKISKRATMIVANLIGMVGISITMMKNFYAFCAGRLVFGVCIGILQIVGPTFLVMSVPPDLMVIFGPFINIIINFGIFLNSLLAYILPDDTDPTYMTSNSWRIIFAVPLVFQVLQILTLLLFVRHDYDNLEAFYRERHTKPNVYREMVNKLYRTEGNGGGNN